MKSYVLLAVTLILTVSFAAPPVRAQQVTTETVDGVTNFKRLETTVACAGAVKATAVPELKKMGFASIINLRQPTEQGADVEGEAAAAKAVDMHYYSIPFSGRMPDPAVADKFLDTVTAKNNDPAFIHCASGNRAATMWMIKRLVVDHWDVDRAGEEAAALGLTSGPLKQFAIDYAQTHKR
jgi:protein tyrosine phosphatase (PTP) superfamily phosphohydrolase (DUF442 family)